MNQEWSNPSGFERHLEAPEGTQDNFAENICKKFRYE